MADKPAPPFKLPGRAQIDSVEITAFTGADPQARLDRPTRRIMEREKIDRLVKFINEHDSGWVTQINTPQQYRYAVETRSEEKLVSQFWVDGGSLGALQTGKNSSGLRFRRLNFEEWESLKGILDLDER